VRLALVVLALAIATPVFAEEPVGCDKFKWPIDKERLILTGDTIAIASGTKLPHAHPMSVVVDLKPFVDAKLPRTPERAPKSPTSFAGFVDVPAPATNGTYKISLSAEGWVDVIQSDQFIKASDFSGATGCDVIRKVVKFDLAARPFTIQLSGIATETIRIGITAE
jgi:hypothetical protein